MLDDVFYKIITGDFDDDNVRETSSKISKYLNGITTEQVIRFDFFDSKGTYLVTIENEIIKKLKSQFPDLIGFFKTTYFFSKGNNEYVSFLIKEENKYVFYEMNIELYVEDKIDGIFNTIFFESNGKMKYNPNNFVELKDFRTHIGDDLYDALKEEILTGYNLKIKSLFLKNSL